MNLGFLEADVLYLVILIVSGAVLVFSDVGKKLELIFSLLLSMSLILISQTTAVRGATVASLIIGSLGTYLLYEVVKFQVHTLLKKISDAREGREKERLDLYYDRLMPSEKTKILEAATEWAKNTRLASLTDDPDEWQKKLLIKEFVKAGGIIK